MRTIKKIFRMILITIIVINTVVAVAILLFVNLSPQFGKSASIDQQFAYSQSDNFENGKFINQIPTVMNLDYGKLVKEMLKNDPSRHPLKNIEVERLDSLAIIDREPEITHITWFGHSAFLLELDGKKFLIDPMLGPSPSPHPWLGPYRYSKELPIKIEKLPYIDAVIFSHDHYDHLDYGSIKKLMNKVGVFYVPLGVGNHLIQWGVAKNKVHELNWWDSIMLNEIELICTPARHFSGRGFFDRYTTLWASWVIKGSKETIYFSGDSGYGPHFEEIGEQYGPFDLSLMECGQYNKDWQEFHMLPEETAQAAVDLNSKLMMPIHWGSFTLAFHDWQDPVERVIKAAALLNIPVTTPRIGEPVILGKDQFPNRPWWLDY